MPKKDNEQNRELLNVEFEDNYEVQNEIEEESLDSETVKRRLLNLPQQSSTPSSNNNNSNNGDSSDSPQPKQKKDNDKQKDDSKKNTEKKGEPKKDDDENSGNSSNRRKKRDDDHKKRSEGLSKKPDGKDVGNKIKEQLSNPLKDKTKNMGKKQLKDITNKGLKQGAKQGTKNIAKKGGEKAAAKVAKLAAQAAKKLVVKGIALIGKALFALVSYVGLPAILVGLAIAILIVILMTLSTMMFGTGQGVDELSEEAVELREHIVQLSESSVDMTKPEQIPYRVPEELLAAVIQLESMLAEGGNTGSTEDIKKLLNEVTEQLKPKFTYSPFTEWTETSTRVCANEIEKVAPDGTKSMQCTAHKWSAPARSSVTVNKITSVIAWNGKGTYKYEADETDWVENGDTRTRAKVYVMSEQKFEPDFSKLDAILNERGYALEDKRWFEYFFESATNRQMHYLTWLETGSVPEGAFDFGGGYGFAGDIIPGGGVPPQYMPYYRAAEAKYGIPWHTLAAIHFVETTFSTHPSMTSYVGAIGHMQFMPRTWLGWSYKGGNQTGLGNISGIPKDVLMNPATIKKHGGYGVDANGDGKADPWDVEDAIFSAANYLQKNGYASSPRTAVYHYNHSEEYINKVLSLSEEYKSAATYQPSTGVAGGQQFNDPNFNGSDLASIAINEAYKYLGYPYKWGGASPSTSFDCSGITQWSFKKAGISLPRVSRDQYKATKPISASEAKAGDLVFFVGYKGSSYITHVGMYIGGGKMLSAQNAGLVVTNVAGWNGGGKLYGYTRIPGVN